MQLCWLEGGTFTSPHSWSAADAFQLRPQADMKSGAWVTETKTNHMRRHAVCLFGTYNTYFFFFHIGQWTAVLGLRLDASEGPHVDERKAWLVGYEEGSGQEVTGTKEEEGQSPDPSLSGFCFISQLLTSSYSFSSPGTLLILSVRSPPAPSPHVLCLRMLDRSIKVHSWGTSGLSIMRCHSRCSSP